MADKRTIETDLLSFNNGGRLFSVPDLMRYTGKGRDWVRGLVNGLDGVGQNSAKRYFYTDVAARLAGQQPAYLRALSHRRKRA